MIIVHINYTADADTLTHCYKGYFSQEVIDKCKPNNRGSFIERGNLLLLNPEMRSVRNALKAYPGEAVMCLGHGTPHGLFGYDCEYIIGDWCADLLKGREIIGIWCNADKFAIRHRLTGFFTSMFISNPNEASLYHFEADEETTQRKNIEFGDIINSLIEENVSMDKWCAEIRKRDKDILDFTDYNYKGLLFADKEYAEA